MKIFDKLKNALFEEEYVDVEESKKPLRKEKTREEKVRVREEPIAKKVIIPEPKKTILDNTDTDMFDFQKEMDDVSMDLLPEDDEFVDKSFDVEIPRTSRMSDRSNDFYNDERKEPIIENIEEVKPKIYKVEEPEVVIKGYGTKKEKEIFSVEEESDPLGISGYEKKSEKTHFAPSPIISPIYGVLDKNYRKEEIIPKKEIRFNSRFDKQKLDLDEVRNRAYGQDDIDTVSTYNDFDDLGNTTEFKINRFEEEIVVDLVEEKPEVKEVTIGDASEYYDDLGLEYNNDYKDAKVTGRRVKDEVEPVIEKKDETVKVEEIVNSKVEDDDNDNLFDLIDSMYDKE